MFQPFLSCSHSRANTGLNHVVRISNHMQNKNNSAGTRMENQVEECGTNSHPTSTSTTRKSRAPALNQAKVTHRCVSPASMVTATPRHVTSFPTATHNNRNMWQTSQPSNSWSTSQSIHNVERQRVGEPSQEQYSGTRDLMTKRSVRRGKIGLTLTATLLTTCWHVCSDWNFSKIVQPYQEVLNMFRFDFMDIGSSPTSIIIAEGSCWIENKTEGIQPPSGVCSTESCRAMLHKPRVGCSSVLCHCLHGATRADIDGKDAMTKILSGRRKECRLIRNCTALICILRCFGTNILWHRL